jgi:hypothetical protein
MKIVELRAAAGEHSITAAGTQALPAQHQFVFGAANKHTQPAGFAFAHNGMEIQL